MGNAFHPFGCERAFVKIGRAFGLPGARALLAKPLGKQNLRYPELREVDQMVEATCA